MSAILPPIDELVAAALAEDLGVPPSRLLAAGHDDALLERDVTTAAVYGPDEPWSGNVVARATGVVCGLPVADRVWRMLATAAGTADEIDVYPLRAEGSVVAPGTAVLEVSGTARVVLAAERTALNFVMALSGIATEARRWQDAAGPGLAVLDTRKTLPGLRALSKYAVAVGGAHNHRAGLHDMVLVKDNHVRRAGGIPAAVAAARAAAPGLVVEVEADTLEQALEAVRAGADIVLLDNMDDAALAIAVTAVRQLADSLGRAVLTEASGGVTYGRIPALRAAGVDRVSSSALTLAPPLDFGLDGA